MIIMSFFKKRAKWKWELLVFSTDPQTIRCNWSGEEAFSWGAFWKCAGSWLKEHSSFLLAARRWGWGAVRAAIQHQSISHLTNLHGFNHCIVVSSNWALLLSLLQVYCKISRIHSPDTAVEVTKVHDNDYCECDHDGKLCNASSAKVSPSPSTSHCMICHD